MYDYSLTVAEKNARENLMGWGMSLTQQISDLEDDYTMIVMEQFPIERRDGIKFEGSPELKEAAAIVSRFFGLPHAAFDGGSGFIGTAYCKYCKQDVRVREGDGIITCERCGYGLATLEMDDAQKNEICGFVRSPHSAGNGSINALECAEGEEE